MLGRSAFNPFSSKNPLQSYGQIKKYGDNLEYDGLPYVGPVLPYKEDDSDELKPQLKHNACCAQFNLDKQEDMDQYRSVCQKVCDGLATISFEEKVYDDAIKSWRVLIRWMEPYFTAPKSIQQNKSKPPEQRDHVFPETDTTQPKDVFTENNKDNSEDRYSSVEGAMSIAMSDKNI